MHQPIGFKPDCSPASDTDIGVQEMELPQDAPIRCAACMGAVAVATDRIEVNGAHVHTFANPHGLVFEIGCFHDAFGCVAVGLPTDEFTWFSGFFWQMAFCRTCLTHMGWLFTKKSNGFWGLILDRLMDETG